MHQKMFFTDHYCKNLLGVIYFCTTYTVSEILICVLLRTNQLLTVLIKFSRQLNSAKSAEFVKYFIKKTQVIERIFKLSPIHASVIYYILLNL